MNSFTCGCANLPPALTQCKVLPPTLHSLVRTLKLRRAWEKDLKSFTGCSL